MTEVFESKLHLKHDDDDDAGMYKSPLSSIFQSTGSRRGLPGWRCQSKNGFEYVLFI